MVREQACSREPLRQPKGHEELGVDVPPPNVLARPPTVLPRVEVTTLAAPVAPELVLLLLLFMLGTRDSDGWQDEMR